MAVGKGPATVGNRDTPVAIQRLTESIADSGQPVESWRTVCTEFMSKDDVSARERYQFSQMSSAVTTRFEMAYREDMDPDTYDIPKSRRLLYAGRAYDITMARLIGNLEGIELMALAQVR